MESLFSRALASDSLTFLANKLIGHYITIFMLHRPEGADHSFNGHSLSLVEECLKFTRKKKYHVSTPDKIVADALQGIYPKHPTICFTIDDGFDDEANVLAPVFLRYGIQPTLYVLTDFIDKIDWPWDSKISYLVGNTNTKRAKVQFNNMDLSINLTSADTRNHTRRSLVKFAKTLRSDELSKFLNELSSCLETEIPLMAPSNKQPASWDSLRQLEKNGLIVGSHACTHRLFSSLSNEEISRELTHSKARLEFELKQPSQVFCYPSGTAQDFSESHFSLVKNAGYSAALSAIPGNTTTTKIKLSPYNISRHAFPNDFETFVRYTSWFEALRTRLA